MAKILLVDDDPLLIRMYQTKLVGDGFIVETGCNGEEAIAKAETFKPDLILCDIMTPKMNGLDALKKLKELESTKKYQLLCCLM
ncbi:MAG: response regulator [bacterium]|nr:response regulator [bacterium]